MDKIAKFDTEILPKVMTFFDAARETMKKLYGERYVEQPRDIISMAHFLMQFGNMSRIMQKQGATPANQGIILQPLSPEEVSETYDTFVEVLEHNGITEEWESIVDILLHTPIGEKMINALAAMKVLGMDVS